MFGLMKRSGPIIPTRFPELPNLAVPQAGPIQPAAATMLPADLPVAEGTAETLNTPPLTPPSDTAGETSTDEPSVEYPTVEEVIEMKIIAGRKAIRNYDTKISTNETPDSEAGVTTSDVSTFNARFFHLGYKIYGICIIFWSIALGIGVLAYFMSIHHDTEAMRMREMNLLVMPRERWDDSTDVAAVPNLSSFMAQRVIVVQTDTESCDTITTCTNLLNAMKVRQQKRQEGMLKYNFLLATDGSIYEALGWREPSPMYPEVSTMVVAFIGNYKTLAPSTIQLRQLQSLLQTSQDLKYLADSYVILGKKQTIMPSKLFAYLSAFEYWDKENSDTDDGDVEVHFETFPNFGE